MSYWDEIVLLDGTPVTRRLANDALLAVGATATEVLCFQHAATFYDDDQPRAADGKWSSAAGSAEKDAIDKGGLRGLATKAKVKLLGGADELKGPNAETATDVRRKILGRARDEIAHMEESIGDGAKSHPVVKALKEAHDKLSANKDTGFWHKQRGSIGQQDTQDPRQVLLRQAVKDHPELLGKHVKKVDLVDGGYVLDVPGQALSLHEIKHEMGAMRNNTELWRKLKKHLGQEKLSESAARPIGEAVNRTTAAEARSLAEDMGHPHPDPNATAAHVADHLTSELTGKPSSRYTKRAAVIREAKAEADAMEKAGKL